MIRRDGQRLLIDGPVTLASHVSLRDASEALLADEVETIDWREVDAVDSSALALILHWRRHAATRGRTLAHSNLPGGVIALAQLYGVSDLIG